MDVQYEIREVTAFHVVRMVNEAPGTGSITVISTTYDRQAAERMRVAMMEFDTYHPEPHEEIQGEIGNEVVT